MEIGSALTIISTVTSIITATVLIFTYHQNIKQNKPQFDLTSVYTGLPPNRKPHGFHIQNPTKPIVHCQVFCNGVPLETPFGVHFQKWVYIHAGGAADFILPDDLADIDNATIEVKDGKKNIYPKTKIKDVPYVL
jgi:hypothetical protein